MEVLSEDRQKTNGVASNKKQKTGLKMMMGLPIIPPQSGGGVTPGASADDRARKAIEAECLRDLLELEEGGEQVEFPPGFNAERARRFVGEHAIHPPPKQERGVVKRTLRSEANGEAKRLKGNALVEQETCGAVGHDL